MKRRITKRLSGLATAACAFAFSLSALAAEAPAGDTVIDDGLSRETFAAIIEANEHVHVYDGGRIDGASMDVDTYYATVRGVPVAIGLVCRHDEANCGYITMLASYEDAMKVDLGTLNRINYGSIVPYALKMRPADGGLAVSGTIAPKGVTVDHLNYHFDLFAAAYVAYAQELSRAQGKFVAYGGAEGAAGAASAASPVAGDPLLAAFVRGETPAMSFDLPAFLADAEASGEVRKILNDAFGQ